MDRDHVAAIVNTHFRQTLIAISKVLGENGARDIYKSAKLDAKLISLPPDNLESNFLATDYAQLLQSIEVTYGQRGPRILERIGRESFHLVLRQQASTMGVARRIMGLWSRDGRVRFMVDTLVNTQLKMYPHMEVWSEEKDGHLAYIEQDCLNCYLRSSNHPICSLKTGFIAEAIHWATGSELGVEETDCIALGDAYCRFVIG
jgi:predicted hydrocarbon binding protein